MLYLSDRREYITYVYSPLDLQLRIRKLPAFQIIITLIKIKTKKESWGTLHKEVIGLSFLNFAHCTIKKSR